MKKILIGLCAFGVASYGVSATAGNMYHMKHEKHLDKALRPIISQLGLTGDPLLNRQVPNINGPQAQLGMDLFFSKSLGGNQDSACVTCHHPVLGGGDNLSLPIGVESDLPDLLGPGRTNDFALNNPEGGPPVPRNAPTTFNVIAWDKFQFHDGRVESLNPQQGANGTAGGIRTPDSALGVADPLAGGNLVQAQARFPVTSNEEMKAFEHTSYTNQTIRELLAGRLGGYGDEGELLTDVGHWIEKFRVALSDDVSAPQDLVTEQNVSMLIGEYERSQAFANTSWKSYVEGNNSAISANAKKGALLFFTSSEQGGANCSSCHSGDFFTDESFHNLAMPQIGPGKGDGIDGSKDFGRARETGLEQDKFAFRTPALINVEVTGPWSHAGAYTTLEAVIKHHSNATHAIDNFDDSQLQPANIRNLGLKMQENTQEALNAPNFELETLNLTDMQVGFLVEFLKTLTDPCVKDRECLDAWVPNGELRNDPNGDQLNAIDQYGNLL
ncbi:MAG: cytochrome c peroxidase [Methyloprofundus sp.]|nr:cytochrome c peroxidase [Methyloprofundus sp.]MDT8426205.1 cytochrome c peroxidase [Methyloprofundus sp.]